MLPGGIHILMAKHISDQVNIPGFLVQGSSVGTSELVGSDFLKGSYLLCIFLHQVFHSTYADATFLGGVEERQLMPLLRNDLFAAPIDVISKSLLHLFPPFGSP